jgi:hypothetical protein
VLFTRLNDVRLYVPNALLDAEAKNPPINTEVPKDIVKNNIPN